MTNLVQRIESERAASRSTLNAPGSFATIPLLNAVSRLLLAMAGLFFGAFLFCPASLGGVSGNITLSSSVTINGSIFALNATVGQQSGKPGIIGPGEAVL